MQSQNEKKLEKFEPENDNRSWTRHIKHIVLALVVLVLITNIIVSSVNQIGTQKS